MTAKYRHFSINHNENHHCGEIWGRGGKPQKCVPITDMCHVYLPYSLFSFKLLVGRIWSGDLYITGGEPAGLGERQRKCESFFIPVQSSMAPPPSQDAITVEPVENRRDATAERAAQFLASVGEHHTFTSEEEKAVLKRIDRRILPLILGAYFFQQLDKSSLSYVSIFGIVEDANLQGQEYSWLGSILYLAQLVMQPLAAFLLVKAPTGKLIGSAIFLWGSSLAIMAACTDFKSLLGLRFALGAFEAMIGMCGPRPYKT